MIIQSPSSPGRTWTWSIVWIPLVWSSQLIPYLSPESAWTYSIVFRPLIWVLWFQPFSNRLPNPTSKLNDSGWINFVTVWYAQRCTVVSVWLSLFNFVVKPSSELFQTDHCNTYPFPDFPSVNFAAFFLSVWTFPPPKNTFLTLKLFQLCSC